MINTLLSFERDANTLFILQYIKDIYFAFMQQKGSNIIELFPTTGSYSNL